MWCANPEWFLNKNNVNTATLQHFLECKKIFQFHNFTFLLYCMESKCSKLLQKPMKHP